VEELLEEFDQPKLENSGRRHTPAVARPDYAVSAANPVGELRVQPHKAGPHLLAVGFHYLIRIKSDEWLQQPRWRGQLHNYLMKKVGR
jgi:hypothetical protein